MPEHDDYISIPRKFLPDDPLLWAFGECSEYLDGVKALFTDQVRVTLLVRNLDRSHADMIITDDDDEAIRSRMQDYLDLT